MLHRVHVFDGHEGISSSSKLLGYLIAGVKSRIACPGLTLQTTSDMTSAKANLDCSRLRQLQPPNKGSDTTPYIHEENLLTWSMNAAQVL